MKPFLFSLIAAILIVACPTRGIPAEPTAAKAIENYVVVFVAPFHCPPCEKLKKTLKALTARTGFPVLVIRDAHIASRLGVKAYPTSFGVLKGRIVKKGVGALTETQLLGLLPKGSWTPIKPDAKANFVLGVPALKK